MKSMKQYFPAIIALGISAGLLTACTKTFDEKTPGAYGFADASNVQLYVATVGAARNYIYVDGKPQNGAAISSGTAFPATGYGFRVPVGSRAFLLRDTLTATTQTPLSFANIIAANKNYTIFSFDTITAVKQKTVETTITVPSDTTCRVRFANFAYSPIQMANVDLYSFKRASNVITNIAPTDVTGFFPFASALNDTLQVRETGTTNVLAQLNGFLPTQKRSYTLVFRGSYRGPTARFLSSFVNY